MSVMTQIGDVQEAKPSENGGADIWQVKFSRNPDISWTTLGGETVLLNVDNGFYYTLNDVGSVVWEQFSGDQPLSDILTVIQEQFDVEEDVVREDLNALLTMLRHEKLIA